MSATPAALIARKRDGLELTANEIEEFVVGYTNEQIPDYQMSALAMAIYFQGMSPRETAALTQAMLDTGTVLTWGDDGAKYVDKHSTGGVGDKVSLALAPLLACCDLRVPMVSGRGLGPTGGTLDKLESIPGFRTDLATPELQRVVDQVGCVINGTTEDIAPADRRLYALRDVTGTVPSVPLITASILSKKLAEGLDALVLDVKFGSGAFMKSIEDARELARSLVSTASCMGVATTALLTDMNQPLGRMIGNAVEVDESVAALSGSGPEDLTKLTLTLGAELLAAVDRAQSTAECIAMLEGHIDSGKGLEKFREMVSAQGGDLDAPRRVAPETQILATESGFVSTIETELLGQAIIELGGGRRFTGDSIDHSVGLEMLVRTGDQVEPGQPLLRVFARPDRVGLTEETLSRAVCIRDQRPSSQPLVAERIQGHVRVTRE